MNSSLVVKPHSHIPTSASREPSTVSTELVRLLHHIGARQAFGVIGGAVSAFCHALSRSEISYLHFRHETGAAFAALEASLASGKPTIVFTTAGPGITNALTGMTAARWDGGKVILISACTSAPHRGRVATQETGPSTLPGYGLFLSGPPFHYATVLEHPAQLGATFATLARGVASPGGFVAHISLPIALQREPAPKTALPQITCALPVSTPAQLVSSTAKRLAGSRFVVWLGFGARHAEKEVLDFVSRTGAKVMCSPRAKGILPEDHPSFLGVTGLGGHDEVDRELAHIRPEHILVLGSRLGESTSFWGPEPIPLRSFIHVDIDPSAFGAAYPHVETLGIVSDIAPFLRQLIDVWPASRDAPEIHLPTLPPPPALAPRASGLVRPQVVLAALQREVVDRSDAIVIAESGNSFCWATHLLRFPKPGRYRVSTGFGSMGHATTGVVGAALARRGKAFALAGDGAMLMLNEISSAVQYRADAVWVVLNDSCYLMCEQGMVATHVAPFGTELPRTDFVALARALGADGIRVESEQSVSDALRLALSARGPFVVDIRIDPREVAPSGKRNRNLMQQGSDLPVAAG